VKRYSLRKRIAESSEDGDSGRGGSSFQSFRSYDGTLANCDFRNILFLFVLHKGALSWASGIFDQQEVEDDSHVRNRSSLSMIEAKGRSEGR
jgi:hypothetical protein